MNVSPPRPDDAAPRMAPLARLPIFLMLEGRRVVVAGDNAAAAWKAELLSAAGACVEVYAAAPCPELRAIAAHAPRGLITLHCRRYTPADCAGAAIAIGAFAHDADAEHFAAAAHAAAATRQ